MVIFGFELRTVSNNAVIRTWQEGTIPPAQIVLPNGDNVFGATDGWTNGVYSLNKQSWTVADPVPPPKMVTARQARLAINTVPGLRTLVENAISTSDQNTKDYWDFSSELHQDNPILLNIANQVGLSAAQVDSLFTLGQTL